MEQLTKESFKEKIFNYEKHKDWEYKGDKPCIIDFYANWCQPCKLVSPILEELNQEYEGKIVFYSVDVDVEYELADIFGIKSIPSILFIPLKDTPQMAVGALPKNVITDAISEIFNIQYPGKA